MLMMASGMALGEEAREPKKEPGTQIKKQPFLPFPGLH